MRDWLAQTADTHPDAIALLRPHDDLPTFSAIRYCSLHQRVAHQAARLAAVGVQRGDRVGLLMGAHEAQVVLILALAGLGAALVPFNTRLTPDELRYQADTAACSVILFDRPNEMSALALRQPGRALYTIGAPQDTGTQWLPEQVEGVEAFLDGDIDLNTVQSIIFTSGTTGRPKGAQITFGNLYASAQASAARLGVQPDDRWLLTLPLYHVGGLSVLFRSVLYGTAIVLPERPFQPDEAARLMHEQHITLVSLVPTMLYRLLEAGFTAPPSLRLILLGGAAASPQLLEQAAARGLPVATTYGLTEAASQVATMLPDAVQRKPGSVGKPLPGVTVRIVDESSASVGAGEHGEIVVSGATVFAGYLNVPESRTLRDRELFTGDVGYLDADGDLWLVDRRSDLIVSGGENVYPAEVENVLREHPAVGDVCVVGTPDVEWGARVAAAVVLRPGMRVSADELLAFGRARLAGYKQPRRIVFVNALPQTASGKVQRGEVAKQLSAASFQPEKEG